MCILTKLSTFVKYFYKSYQHSIIFINILTTYQHYFVDNFLNLVDNLYCILYLYVLQYRKVNKYTPKARRYKIMKIILNDENKILTKVVDSYILMFKDIKNKEYNFTTKDWNEMNNHISKCMYQLGIF